MKDLENERNERLDMFEKIWAEVEETMGKTFYNLLKKHPKMSAGNLSYFFLMNLFLNLYEISESEESVGELIIKAREQSKKIWAKYNKTKEVTS